MAENPADVTETISSVQVQTDWTQGLEPLERPGNYGFDQGMMSIIVVLILALCLSAGNIRRIWSNLTRRLWNTRIHQGFDNTTASEKRTIGLLLVVTVTMISLIATAGLSEALPTVFPYTLQTTSILAALTAGYFLFQYIVYNLVGYTFCSEEGQRMWVEGFTGSMTLLGVILLFPGLVILFYPAITNSAIIFSVLLYILARIAFIFKGFRIFYTNSGSLVYFILYLCSLEIIPLLILFNLAKFICQSVN